MSAGCAILALNSWLSSLKFALFEIDAPLALTAKGEIETLDGTPHARELPDMRNDAQTGQADR